MTTRPIPASPPGGRVLHPSISMPDFSTTPKSEFSRRVLRPPTSPGSPSSVDLQQHIYNSLLESRTADISLHVRGTWEAVYKLHRVVLIQSGFFNSLFTAGFLESSPTLCSSLSGTQDIDIVFDDRNITRAAFEVCISRLYGGGPPLHVCPSLIPTRTQPLTPSFTSPAPSSDVPNGHHPAGPRFLLSLLATAVYLSIPTVASQALGSIFATVGPYTVVQYLRFATGIPIEVSDNNEPEAAVGLDKIATLLHSGSSIHSTLASHDTAKIEPLDLADKLHDLAVQKEDPAESDGESEPDGPQKHTPCFNYGVLSDKIGEAAVCWLVRWGPDMFEYEKASARHDFPNTVSVPPTPRRRAETMPSRPSTTEEMPLSALPSRVPVIWAKGGLSSKWIRELISSDALFVKGERERYDLARAVVEFRRRQGIDEDEEKDWEIMFREGIYYANMPIEDIIAISQDISPSTGRQFVPTPALQAAHWNQSLLRCQIISKPTTRPPSPPPSPPPREKELGICLTTAEILSRLSPSDQSHPLDEREKVYYPVAIDSSTRFGDSSGLEGASMDELFDPPAPLSDNKTTPRVPTSEANFFGLRAEKKTASECIATDMAGKTRWSPYPPYRFAVEFWDIDSLKEKSRLHSHTIWYAGSLYNVYVQVVRKKGTQLGIYLHRQSNIDPIPGASAPVQVLRERHHNRAPSFPHTIPCSISSSTIHFSPSIHPPSRSVTPSSASSAPHTSIAAHQSSGNSIPLTAAPVAPPQPYRDPRPSVSAYFSMSCSSSTGSSITRFTSVPDVFSVSQSWGWKSSSLRADDLEDDGQVKPSAPASKMISLRATVVLGLV